MENGKDGGREDSRDNRRRMVRLQAPPKPLDWMRVARALHWDPLCLPGPTLTYQARAVAYYLDRETPDCVLPNLSRPNAATLLACRLMDKHPPVVPVMRNFVHYDRFRTRRRHRHLAREAMHFVGVSQGVSESLAASIGVPRSSITTIYNPVVTPRLHVERAEQPEHPWFRDGGAPVILAVGRLTAQKDYPTLIKAFAHLAARRPCRLIILGEGKNRRELEDLVERLHLTDQVSLPGWADNPFSFMSHASLFVLSSLHEGLPESPCRGAGMRLSLRQHGLSRGSVGNPPGREVRSARSGGRRRCAGGRDGPGPRPAAGKARAATTGRGLLRGPGGHRLREVDLGARPGLRRRGPRQARALSKKP